VPIARGAVYCVNCGMEQGLRMGTGTKTIKATHRSVKAYYETLKRYAGQDVSHETAVRSAFQNLLADVAKLHGWTLIPELSHSAKTGAVRPDGTIRDDNYLPRGYWEAKDTADNLDAEIRKKIARGYPTSNIIRGARPFGWAGSRTAHGRQS
jgi:hypothetical protein